MTSTTLELREKIILVGIYIEGIYPPGDMSVVPHLLAPAILKASADSDPEIVRRYEIVVENIPASLDNEAVVEFITAHTPVAVGFSAHIWNIELIRKSAKILRAKCPAVKIFVGGPEVTYMPVEFLENNREFDFVVCGSGEERLKALLKNGLRPDVEPRVSRVTYRDDSGNIIVGCQPDSLVPEDLSKIPSPFQTGVINLNDGKRHCVFIETYRGCIFKCGYCMWMGENQDKKLNLFPIEQVLKDLEIIYNNPNVAAVYFIDACIFYTKERAKAITDTISKCKYKIPTTLTLDIAFMDESAVHSVKQLELSQHKFHFGMQSVNMETMQLMNRKVGPHLFRKRVDMMRGIVPDLELSLDLIYGLPGDTFYTFRKTVDFALSLSPIKLNLSPLVLLPGSTFWMEKEKHGFVYEQAPPFLVHWNKTYSAEDMRKTRRFVLGVIMIMYFRAIRETIFEMTKNYIETVIEEAITSNDFASGDETEFNANHFHSRVGIFELFIDKFEKRSGVCLDVDSSTGSDRCSAINYNFIRKSTMDEIAKPINALCAYQVMLEILHEAGRDDLNRDIELGIRYYQLISSNSHDSLKQCAQEIGDKECNRLKFSWVVSSEIQHKDFELEVSQTTAGGIGILC